ncbi:MAG: UDP-N-acetylmuramoyl-L-alanine--D-glutamate ligase [Lachnospiraceae bacterium]|nr:UDP-N-acetylmuramoyl-L-alanine--D-glutamate ligase [Lachnospiraceae bacterium]
MKAIRKFDNKAILIWGYGREGQSTEQFLRRCCRPKSIEIFEGKREDIHEDWYDYIIKSPGIAMDGDDPKYTSQTEIFLEAFAGRTVGVTGTKGKSTTAAMLHSVLSEGLNKKVIFLGNIGEPCLSHFEEVDGNTVVVFEMSCHQLAHTAFSPHIAVFLNLYEEHLDYYKTFDRYFAAKQNISRHQTGKDVLYIGAQVPPFQTKAKKIVIDEPVGKYDLKILGGHNNYNAEFVFRVATEQFHIDPGTVRDILHDFEGLPHRLQFIGEKDGILYYDDSISTIPDATVHALQSVPHAYSVLIGGMDRGIDYGTLVRFMKEHKEYAYICMYDSGRRILDELGEQENCYYAKDLQAAVKLAGSVTPQGRACILSPASASYGFFTNFEERGDKFREYAGL